MYSGAGLNRSNANIKDNASRDLCPPLSSDNDCFQTPPNATRTSRPSKKLPPSGGSNFAVVPGNNVEKIDPKSLFTFTHVTFRVSFFFSSSSSITFLIFALSFSIIFFFDIKSLYSSSAFSNIAMTFLFTLFSRFDCSACSLSSSSLALRGSQDAKS
uniref:Uncharacterized protein n=1 Tax=Opuntia streptacantha TaxID=393608 RepID=A0A7C9AIN1_OPUST